MKPDILTWCISATTFKSWSIGRKQSFKEERYAFRLLNQRISLYYCLSRWLKPKEARKPTFKKEAIKIIVVIVQNILEKCLLHLVVVKSGNFFDPKSIITLPAESLRRNMRSFQAYGVIKNHYYINSWKSFGPVFWFSSWKSFGPVFWFNINKITTRYK